MMWEKNKLEKSIINVVKFFKLKVTLSQKNNDTKKSL